MKRFFFPFLCVAWAGLNGCSPNSEASTKTAPLFTLLPADSTHITFNNRLTEGLNTNVLMYEYFYNGGGVAVADLNGDGLQDIYFTANMAGNQLYLNRGGLRFEDITQASGATGRPGPWKTGVTIADVNGDGKPDIYISYSGKVRGTGRISQLYINEGKDAATGIPHFTEQAERYGLADSSYNTQAFFFDYDRDGDLDQFSLNHNPNNLPVLDEASTAALLKQSDPSIGVKLYRNDNNHFSDVTQQAGLNSSVLTYGLGAGIADINRDGWQDIYITNDYNVPDFLYINNGNGTFTDRLQACMGHTSKSSMGNDVADINNDGLPDIFVLDMLPEDNRRQKSLFAPDNYEKFDVTVRSGFYYQYMRNTLQLNNGDGSFSETGQLAGISNTDWSWAPLFADYDNDGWKDLYVTNGYTRDFTNMDFLKYMNDYVKSKGRLKREDVLEILQQMPASNVSNYLFRNKGDLTFADSSAAWGVGFPSNSNGAAYADLDNDGDLDLVVNNINLPAFIYRNEADHLRPQRHFLNVRLEGTAGNTDGIGAQVFIYARSNRQYLEQMPARGYQSTVSAVLHAGLGGDGLIDSLRVVWLGGKSQTLFNIKTDRLLTLKQGDAVAAGSLALVAPQPAFREVEPPLAYRHACDDVNDFKRQPLLVNPLSFTGPCMAKADVNGDGLEDVYAGGGSGQAGTLYLQQQGGKFAEKRQPAFAADKGCEDADALFFDADGNGAVDLYVVSGGYHHYAVSDSLLQDRLYLGDGKGNFTKAQGALPAMLVSKSCARAADVNGDGYADLFVGGRNKPGQYPETPKSWLLINDGKGHFTDRIGTLAPRLEKTGMVSDAAWADFTGDGKPDLLVAGEWMPLSVFVNKGGKLEREGGFFEKEYSGWWNKLLLTDINGDGIPDLVAGNTGLNTQCRASEQEPAELYYKDFDGNGSVDPVLCLYIQHKSYPYVSRDELLDQISMMRTRFADYKSYADAGIGEVFSPEEMKGAQRLQATCLKTTFFEWGKDGKFHEKDLPLQAQFSPVYAIAAIDYNRDGHQDLLLCGNENKARMRFGKSDANYGVLLQGDGTGKFQYISQSASGFHLRGDVRSILRLNNTLLFGINGEAVKAYQVP